MNAHPVLLQKKYSRIIEAFAKKVSITRDEALDFFYHSTSYELISQGVSDLHCMSDEYLAEELEMEYAGIFWSNGPAGSSVNTRGK